MLTRMLDTDICIYVVKNRPIGLLDRFEAFADELSISAITLGELQYGIEKSTQRERNAAAIQAFVAQLSVLDFDAPAARHFGELRAELERAGTPCGLCDMQIGAHARSRGLIVVSNNRREFARMPGVRLETWI